MKARIFLILGALIFAMAAFAPAASAVSGYGPTGCEDTEETEIPDPNGDGVIECETEVPTEVENGKGDDPVESTKLAYTGSSTQMIALIAAGLIGGGALMLSGTRRFGSR